MDRNRLGEGKALSNSLVHGLPEQIGGSVWVDSIMLPGHDEKRSPAAPPSLSGMWRGCGGRMGRTGWCNDRGWVTKS